MVGVVNGEGGNFFHIQPVDILLEETKQGQVQRGQPGLLALKNKPVSQQNFSRSRMPSQAQKKLEFRGYETLTLEV